MAAHWFRRALWPAGATFGLAAEWISFGWDDPRHWIPDVLTGWTLIGCGLVAWSRRPESRAGVLMALTGFTWFVGNFAASDVDSVAWLGAQALYLYRGPLVHLLVTFPSGRLSSRFDRVVVCFGYVAAIVTPVWRSEVATVVLVTLVVSTCGHAYFRAVGPVRRARLLAFQVAAGLGLVLAAGAAARLVFPAGDAADLALLALEASLCASAGVLLAGLLVPSLGRSAVTDLVVELGEGRSATLRDELSRALGDPTLEVGYWLPDASTYVDSEGRRLALPDSRQERSVTVIESQGEPLAALVHDPAVLGDSALMEAVSSATRLAAANARLQAEARAQVEELRASRRRILVAGDVERQRLEARLREGAKQRLERIAEQLGQVRVTAPNDAVTERIDLTEAQLGLALEDLDRLAQGLHPRILTEAGLENALASLAEQSAIPIDVVAPAARLPAEIEAVAYFFCSEALVNIGKHAAASRASLSVTTHGELVRIEVEDDGRGGVEPALGTGVRGLADRVEALGGSFRLESRADTGTRLAAEIPFDGEAP